MKTTTPKPQKKTPVPSLMDFVKATKKNRGGHHSPIADNPRALADLEAFARLKAGGTVGASWEQFGLWFRQTHGIDLRANSLYTYARNRGYLDGK